MFIVDTLRQRQTAAATTLAPLADSLAADLDVVLSRELFIPPEKARMTRIGGQCALDGSQLTFDPFSPHEHVCPRCGTRFRQNEHYRAWITFYQQWLAERAVHAATLHALRGDPRHRSFAESIIRAYTKSYDSYPNSDNVLGPSRLFFSTYLESIWLLQLCVAADLLGLNTASGLGADFTERLVLPSSKLIHSYNEGDSNRQVWNNAALMAAARWMDDDAALERIVRGPYGLIHHLQHTLLPDGSWYEGENYHQFAHRGLWYGVHLTETANIDLPVPLLARFQSAFVTPFLTAMPDYTYPARRDSRHRVSLRQWRYAESCELGLARADDDRLVGALYRMYSDDIPAGDTGRWRSAAESERNEPPTTLTRADLGWRSLLCARAELPALHESSVGSLILEHQGFAILRRDRGRIYSALDYGHSGGGHGHPDRLNVILADGTHRWLDDPGTGSYVEPTLHWYRSTLAHNAPMFGGRQQQRVAGVLIAHEDRGAAGWVRARVSGLAPDAQATRTMIVMPDYVVDMLDWSSRDSFMDLPLHVDADIRDVRWRDADVRDAGNGDGYAYVRSAKRGAAESSPIALRARDGEASLHGWILSDTPLELWRFVAPGPPGETDKPFVMVRSFADKGTMTIVWSFRDSIEQCTLAPDSVVVQMRDGSRHTHRLTSEGWQVELHAAGARSSIDLGGVRAVQAPRAAERRTAPTPPRSAPAVMTVPRVRSISASASDAWMGGQLPNADWACARVQLGEQHYRQSEQSWTEAGAPTATLEVVAGESDLHVEVTVLKDDPVFAPARLWNELDNERADINSDGVQLYVVVPDVAVQDVRAGAWLMVPEPGGRVRITAVDSTSLRIEARWFARDDGYVVRCRVGVGADALQEDKLLLMEVMVNEISRDRERRRGQLVLSGGAGDFVYLQGDRHRGRWTTLRIVND